METIKLRSLIELSTKEYDNYVSDFLDKLVKDYRSNIRPYTYDNIEKIKDSIFLKDKIIEIDCDGVLYEMTNGNFLSALLIFSILNDLNNDGIEIEDLNDYIFDPSNPEDFNCILDLIYNDFIEVEGIKNRLFNIISNLAKVSARFTSGTISLRDICILKKNDKEFNDMLHFSVNENESFASMIKQIKGNLSKMENKLKTKDTCYRPLITSGAGFNMKQASQVFNLIGPKPDIFGNLHDKAILTNFVNGLRNETDFFINADNCRKALVTNYTAVKDSGYLTRILSMLCLDTKLSDCEKCDTIPENYLKVNIFNEDVLKKYKHRNMWDGEKLVKVGMNRDLIGKVISVASPMTCSCKDGICKTCYGELYKTISSKTLKDGTVIKENIGMIAVLLLTERLTQSLLSTKHLLEASTDEIEWSDDVTSLFDIITNKVILKEDISYSDIIITDYDNEKINKIKVDDNEIELTVPFEINEDCYKIEMDNLESGTYKIVLEDPDSEPSDVIFSFTVRNKELSEPLNNIKDLLNTNAIKERDINGNINYMLYLLDKVGFKISSEHIETIMSELVSVTDKSVFSKPHPNYEMVRASEKVLGDSVIKSLLFERLESQLLKIETYEKENKSSLLDFLL